MAILDLVLVGLLVVSCGLWVASGEASNKPHIGRGALRLVNCEPLRITRIVYRTLLFLFMDI